MTSSLKSRFSVLLVVTLSMGYTSGSRRRTDTIDIDYSLRDMYCDQPIFVNFLEKNEETVLYDNVCVTFFPVPDDPNTFLYHFSIVYCDGSITIRSHITTESGIGQALRSNIFNTVHDTIIGYAGCDTHILVTEMLHGDHTPPISIAGISPKCIPLGLSCLRNVEETISSRGLPDTDFYVLPMKLPNRCVTQQLCLQPPNPFYNSLASADVSVLF